MANPVFSVWSKTGPTLLRFENKPHPLGAVLLYLNKSEKSSLLLKENGAVRVRTWLMKKDKPCKRGKEACKLGGRY